MTHVRTHQQRRHIGITMLEVVVSTFLVGVLLVTSLATLGVATRAGTSSSRRAQAVLLASDLIDEILLQGYLEPDLTPTFGPEGRRERTGIRAAFDDVDDYHDWTAAPPQAKHGAVSKLSSTWTRKVTVNHVDPHDLTTVLTQTDDRGAKRIRVIVNFDGQKLIQMDAIQTRAWLDMIPRPEDNHTTSNLP